MQLKSLFGLSGIKYARKLPVEPEVPAADSCPNCSKPMRVGIAVEIPVKYCLPCRIALPFKDQ